MEKNEVKKALKLCRQVSDNLNSRKFMPLSENVESGAQVNVIESISIKGGATATVTNKNAVLDLDNYVQKDGNKVLSTNDFTDTYKNKVDNLVGESNVIENVSIVGGAAATIDTETKIASLDLSDYAKLSDIATVLQYKGTVESFGALPTANLKTGDVYNITNAGGTDASGVVIRAGDNVAYNGSGWDVLAGTVDLTGYVVAESGKGLSTNDYTTAEKTKLAGIATNANNYSLPTASSSVLGGVKTGSNITNTSGTISLTKANVTAALGYTPPTTDTTYSTGTTSTAGLTKLYTATGTATDGTLTQNAINTQLNLKANLSSPTFTGSPAAPTAATGDNSTKLATTAFVQAAKPAFGICSTVPAAQAKVVTIPGFVLQNGAKITVLFEHTNNAELPTLNVNNTGAFPICYRNKIIARYYLREGQTLDLVYENRDGGLWHILGEIDFTFAPTYTFTEIPWVSFGKPYLSPTHSAVSYAIHFDGRSGICYSGSVTMGGADLTIDCWAYANPTRLADGRIYKITRFTNGYHQFCLNYGANGKITPWVRLSPEVTWQADSYPAASGTLKHYAIVYQHSLNKLSFYIGGELIAYAEDVEVPQDTWRVALGLESLTPNSGNNFFGAIDEFRISKCARWTENFTPQDTAYTSDSNTLLLLHFD